MKQKTTLTAIGALLPFCIQAENDVRNVLFIAIDDLRPTLGCYGDPYAVTPNIDTFATKSFLFENTYCQQSVSGPSRASLLTGLRPDEIGVTDLNTHFREKCPYITTLPQLFKITDMKLSVSVKSIMAVPGHKIRFPGPAPHIQLIY